jgi:dTDP-4-dehydrorhamnose 3,5-epimerase
MPFEFHKLDIPDLILIETKKFEDNRGFFRETYKRSDFVAHGIPQTFLQVNHSHSTRGVIRGLHYQKHPMAQGKLVTASSGKIFDVAVDMRRGSPTYARWIGVELSADNGRLLYIPAGFAHGFCTLSEQADLIYMVTREYSGENECGVVWNDPEIGIEWPIADPILSARDEELPSLARADNNFE